MGAEIIVSLLSLLAASVAVAGVVHSFASVRHKSIAERRFLGLLASDPSAVIRVRELRNQIMHDGVTTPAELRRLIACLESLSRALPEDQRRLVAEGLHQRSLRGRARYAAKLMNKAGIASGSLPIALP